MTLAVADRKAEAAAIFSSHGVPHRRVEEWKYSDLRVALGDAGIGSAQAELKVVQLPAGVEAFDLSQANAPDWVTAHFGQSHRHVMSAASLSLAQGGVAFRVSQAIAEPLKPTGIRRPSEGIQCEKNCVFCRSWVDRPNYPNCGRKHA